MATKCIRCWDHQWDKYASQKDKLHVNLQIQKAATKNGHHEIEAKEEQAHDIVEGWQRLGNRRFNQYGPLDSRILTSKAGCYLQVACD
jgi:hypothetical protein